MSQTASPAQGVLSAEAALAAIRAQRLQVRFLLLDLAGLAFKDSDRAARMQLWQPQTSLGREGSTPLSSCSAYCRSFMMLSSLWNL